MSIRAMNWVWSMNQQLKPSTKLVLLSLADSADDAGVCWPAIKTIANKTCLDERSVQRILRTLERNGLVKVSKRHRQDGSRTSNQYKLIMSQTPDDILSPRCGEDNKIAPAKDDEQGDIHVTQTTSEPLVQLPQPESGSGSELIFTEQLLPTERERLKQMLEIVPINLKQHLLDELAAVVIAGSVKTSACAYMRGLIARASKGEFIPEAGLKIAARRQQQALIAQSAKQAPKGFVPFKASSISSKSEIQNMRALLSKKGHE